MPDRTILYSDPTDYVAQQYYHGGYERAERWACRQLVRRGGTVVDVGANIGIYTQLAAQLVGDHGRVVAFEPGPALPRLRAVTAGLRNVDVVAAALGQRAGAAVMHVPAHQAGLASLRSGADHVDARSVRVLRLDECETVPHREIDLVKVDVEGYEGEVLLGADTLYRDELVRATLVEASPSFGSIAFVEETCDRFGLKALTLSYRVGLRYRPTAVRYSEDDVRAAGQANVLLLRPDVALDAA